MPLAEATTTITDSGRPVPRTIGLKLVGSIRGYNEASSHKATSVMDLTGGSGGFDDRWQWTHGLTGGSGESESESRDKREKKLIKY